MQFKESSNLTTAAESGLALQYLPQTTHARVWRKKGRMLYMSVKVLGCFGSHCSTARLADTYKAVALTGFIAVRSAGSLKKLRLR